LVRADTGVIVGLDLPLALLLNERVDVLLAALVGRAVGK
jgi:hypothetical protein